MYLEKSIQRKTRHQITEKNAHEFSCKNVISTMTELRKAERSLQRYAEQSAGMAKATARSSRKGRRVDALAQRADERRDKLR